MRCPTLSPKPSLLTGRHAFDLRHVAELPVVSADAVLCGPLERHIGVMIRFINLVHQRRTLLGPDTTHTMTFGDLVCCGGKVWTCGANVPGMSYIPQGMALAPGDVINYQKDNPVLE